MWSRIQFEGVYFDNYIENVTSASIQEKSRLGSLDDV